MISSNVFGPTLDSNADIGIQNCSESESLCSSSPVAFLRFRIDSWPVFRLCRQSRFVSNLKSKALSYTFGSWYSSASSDASE